MGRVTHGPSHGTSATANKEVLARYFVGKTKAFGDSFNSERRLKIGKVIDIQNVPYSKVMNLASIRNTWEQGS